VLSFQRTTAGRHCLRAGRGTSSLAHFHARLQLPCACRCDSDVRGPAPGPGATQASRCQTLFLVSKTAHKNQEQSLTPPTKSKNQEQSLLYRLGKNGCMVSDREVVSPVPRD